MVHFLMVGYYGAWASARTLFTFCVHADEIGKIYAAVGIFASLAPLASNPVYKQLYNAVSVQTLIILYRFNQNKPYGAYVPYFLENKRRLF